MKKTALAAIAVALTMGFTACNDKQSGSDNKTTPTDSLTQQITPVDPGEGFNPTTNIRFVDLQLLLENYYLAKDVNDFMVRSSSELQQAQRTREAEIQRFANQVEEKRRTGGYLSEASYNADMQKLQNMYEAAQRALGTLQQKSEEEISIQNQQVFDSIQAFLVDYNKTRHYDAILMKASGLYFNPSLDITQEVLEGLNARYNKVSK